MGMKRPNVPADGHAVQVDEHEVLVHEGLDGLVRRAGLAIGEKEPLLEQGHEAVRCRGSLQHEH
eukprot:15316287-Alexandrium_andersonii.AAC.1